MRTAVAFRLSYFGKLLCELQYSCYSVYLYCLFVARYFCCWIFACYHCCLNCFSRYCWIVGSLDCYCYQLVYCYGFFAVCGEMASSADGLGPSEVATPVVADLGPSQETGNSTADDSNGLPTGFTTGLTTSVWTGEHPTIQAAVEDAAYYRSLIPRYEEYFKDREILNHPEEWTIMRRVVTMVVHDINQGRLTSVDKDILASALIACGVKPLMIQKSNYANYDILLESEEKAREAAAKVHKSKNLKMEPMYMGRRHTTLTLYNVPVNITKECLGAYFARWGDIETIIAGRLKCGVFSANWRISMKTTTADYEKIPDYLICRGQQVTVVVEGRKGYCFSCRQQGHLARDCPLRQT